MIDIGAVVGDNLNGVILFYIAFVSIMATIIALIISLIKKVFGLKLSPAFRYYIWFVFIIRLIFPLLPQSGISVYSIAVNIYQSTSSLGKNAGMPQESGAETQNNENAAVQNMKKPANSEISDEIEPSVTEGNAAQFNKFAPTPEKSDTNGYNAMLFIYLTAAAGSLFLQALKYFRYRRKMLRSFTLASKEETDLLDHMRGILGVKRKIKLYRGDESMLIGVFSPAIVLARDCGDKNIVIAHELLHYKNKDNIINALIVLIKCLYWFNPFIHYFAGRIKNDMELLCDVRSIQTLNYRKDEYAIMLFNASKNNNKPFVPAQATSMSASGKQLIYRLKFISAFRRSSKIMTIISAVLVTALIATTLTNPIMAMGGSWAEPYAQLLTNEGVYDYTGLALSGEITAAEYAELLVSAFKNMTVPYEFKIKASALKSGVVLLALVNANLPNADKINPAKTVTREQAAYIADTVINYLGLYADTKGELSFAPPIMTAEMFEQEVIAKIGEGTREERRMNAFYAKKDLNSPALTEEAKQELLAKYPICEKTAVYICDPLASEREMLEILSWLNHYTNLTDADIIRTYMEYGIISTNFIGIGSELDPICRTPSSYITMAGISPEDVYIQTTLADESLTKEEYDYILQNYLQEVVLNNYKYYKLKDGVTAAQKKEIAEIISSHKEYSDMVTEIIREELAADYPDGWYLRGNTPDVPEEYWDKYERFDDEYDIPLVVEKSRLESIFTFVYKNPKEVLEEEIVQNEKDKEKLLGYYEEVDYASEHMNVKPEDVTVYKLRDDIAEDTRKTIDSFMQFGWSGKDTVSIFEINGASGYKDITKISAWARESVEKSYKTGIMTGDPDDKFNPAGKVTWGQAAKIVSNILFGACVY